MSDIEWFRIVIVMLECKKVCVVQVRKIALDENARITLFETVDESHSVL